MVVRNAHVGATLRLVFGSVVLASCAYQPDSFSYAREPFRGFYLSVDCLDLAVDHRKHGEDSDVLAYEFGNRCDQPIVVDLAAARVYGRTDSGAEVALFPFDPLREIRMMRLDGRAYGREAIEYPSGRTLERVCVDAASIAHVSPARWICFNHKD